MKNVFFNDEVISVEKDIYTSLKIPALILMENAGLNSAGYILANYPEELKNELIILTGKGNNAGDGFVIARHLLSRNISVKILMIYPPDELKDDALTNLTILDNINSDYLKIIECKVDKVLKREISKDNEIIIDAIFGVGFKGELENRVHKIIEDVNSLNDKKIISIDTPSGLYNYNQDAICIRASETLTMGVKKFHSLFYKGKESSGIIKVMDIGFSENEFNQYNRKKIFEIESPDVKKFLPKREINSHKYSNGKVFILAGSKGLTGAASLCSLSALRMGSGAVITGTPESLIDILEVKLTEVMKLPLNETNEGTLSIDCYEKIKQKLYWADVILIGPGLSKNEDTMELVRKILRENDLNFVIDADGIAALRGNLNLLKRRNNKIILTPHIGEFSNLIGVDINEVKNNFYEISKNFAKEYDIILILKGSPTIITEGENFYINSTGRENLATVGAGDVLSGIISSLYSQSKNALNSALAGVYIHGMCGDTLYEKYGPSSTIAGDLIKKISWAKKKIMLAD